MGTYLQFRIGGEAFACSLVDIREIIHPPRLIRPANAPSVLDGFADIGGSLVAVLRLDRLFGIEYRVPVLYRHILRLKDNRSCIGLLVDRAEAVTTAGDEDRRPASDDLPFSSGITGALATGNGLVHELSLPAVLSDAEQQFLAGLVAEEERRRALFEEGSA